MSARHVRQVEVIGIGAGSPGHLTVGAIDAIRRVDTFLVAHKGDAKRQLVALREEVVRRSAGDHPHRFVTLPDPQRGPDAARPAAAYAGAVRDWHEARTVAYAEVIAGLPPDEVVGFLVWGDPAFYDSTIRVVDNLAGRMPLDVRITPGITAFQALAAAHGTVLHGIGEPVHITTGRRLVESYSPDLGTVVVMLDGHLRCAELVERFPDLQIQWGAQLGLPSQALDAGRLSDVIDRITSTRAQIRRRDGWVMDVYALSSG
ncbi:precorrin-6A synthase (deacetylating) [Flexivirga meconopsidis]|uniref:precorrin-6A synthase (deacetylating) n=1 Tax=Flexivirga meconopsidis TaxID=2977121 RepID=UPI00224064B7|nr:precorrin-6A synthase (deacetylating) [Flexivirga meconopsidis]